MNNNKDNKKKGGGARSMLTDIVERAQKEEEAVTKIGKPQVPKAEEPIPIMTNEILEEKNITSGGSPAVPEEKKVTKFEEYFNTSTNYGLGESNLKIPMSIHKELKLLSAHSGVPILKIVSNILFGFLQEYKKDIAKLKK